MKKIIKRILNQKQINAIVRIITAVESICVSSILIPAKIFPLTIKAGIKEALKPIGCLDYPNKSIRMFVNSHWQYYRLKSCAKEPETIKWIEDNMRPGDIFYDIGANVGAYSLVAFALMEKNTKIYSFEPSFTTFKELCHNIFLNQAQGNIIPLQLGLGAKTELASFGYSELAAGAARHNWEFSDREENVSQSVYKQPTLCYRIDDLVDMFDMEPPTLIKIDVDGPELEVLKGANVALANKRLRSLLIEVEENEADDIIDLLSQKGFSLLSKHPRGNSIGNFIFTRKCYSNSKFSLINGPFFDRD